MERCLDPSNVRKGRFLWMNESDRSSYLEMLRNRIAEGYFFSDAILTRVVEELAPVLGDTAEN